MFSAGHTSEPIKQCTSRYTTAVRQNQKCALVCTFFLGQPALQISEGDDTLGSVQVCASMTALAAEQRNDTSMACRMLTKPPAHSGKSNRQI